MKRVAAWVLAAVLSAGAAGVAAGLALCQRVADGRDAELQAADRELVEGLRADLRLSGRQTEILRAVLRTLRDEESAIYRRNFTDLPAKVFEQLSSARRAAEARIRFMLDAEQRARYEQERASANDKR